MHRLEGKVAIITGAGSGMGRASALLFAQEGAAVVVADIQEEAGRETVAQIKKEGGKAEFIKTDVTSAKAVEEMVKFTVKTYGKLNILYNNAGAAVRSLGDGGKMADIPEVAWDKGIEINLKSVFLCCKYSIPEMIKSGGGSIINVSSGAGLGGGNPPGAFGEKVPTPFPNAYGAAKGALIPMTKHIAVAYGADNIRCNVISPGVTETNFFANNKAFQVKENRDSLAIILPLRRLGKAEDIARAALFLASDDSAYITGQTLPVDGGFTAY